MKSIKILPFLLLLFLVAACNDDEPEETSQSDRCNMGDRATLTLNIPGVGIYNYTESATAVSHATDTEGSGVDALSMFIRWVDPITDDSLLFDVTVENETLAVSTYSYDALSFNGTVNFYIYNGGILQGHYTFDDWQTTITDFEIYNTSSAGGYTTTRLAFMDAMTSGTFRLIGGGATIYPFTSSYTICPKY